MDGCAIGAGRGRDTVAQDLLPRRDPAESELVDQSRGLQAHAAFRRPAAVRPPAEIISEYLDTLGELPERSIRSARIRLQRGQGEIGRRLPRDLEIREKRDQGRAVGGTQ